MEHARGQPPESPDAGWLRPARAALAVASCTLSLSAFAAIYKWVGADGRVHYADTPPPASAGAPARVERIELPAAPAARVPAAPGPVADPSSQPARAIDARRAGPAAESGRNDEPVAGERRCLEARQQFAVLEALHLPVYRTPEGALRALWRSDPYQGERVYLDAAERSDQTSRARETIARWCRDRDPAAAQALARARWIASEHCAVARAGLQAEQQPAARRSGGEIESARARVDEQCAVPDSGAAELDSLPAPGLPPGRRPG